MLQGCFPELHLHSTNTIPAALNWQQLLLSQVSRVGTWKPCPTCITKEDSKTSLPALQEDSCLTGNPRTGGRKSLELEKKRGESRKAQHCTAASVLGTAQNDLGTSACYSWQNILLVSAFSWQFGGKEESRFPVPLRVTMVAFVCFSLKWG